MSEDPVFPDPEPTIHGQIEGPPTPQDYEEAVKMGANDSYQVARLLYQARQAQGDLAMAYHEKEGFKYDQITGLPYGAIFKKEVNKKLEELNREEERRSHAPNDAYIVQLDGKGLKAFNTKFGHAGGNIMLHNIGAILKAVALRAEDMYGRLGDGSDEFAIIFFFRNDEIDRETLQQVIDDRLFTVSKHAVEEGQIGGLRWCGTFYELGQDFQYHLDMADPEEAANPGRIREWPPEHILPKR